MMTNINAISRQFAHARGAGRSALDELAAKRVLAAWGIAVPRGMLVPPGREPDLAVMTPPYAAKLVSPDALHKTEVGGVRLGLGSTAAVRDAVRQLETVARKRELRLEGVLVEEMAKPGVELVVGGILDPRFGPVMMLGLGGVFVEIFGDIAFRVCPIDKQDALEMIDDLRAVSLLRGARGRPSVDEGRIVDVLLAVGGDKGLLQSLEGEIAELDINPLIVSESAAVACDARIVLTEK